MEPPIEIQAPICNSHPGAARGQLLKAGAKPVRNLHIRTGRLVVAVLVVLGTIGLAGVGSASQAGASAPRTQTPNVSSSSGTFTSLTPTRVLDTRVGTGAPEAAVAPGASLDLAVDGHGGVPASGVSAVVLNVAVTQATAPGHITVYPDGVSLPNTANLNFVAGQTVSNLVVASVGADGKVDLNNGSSGTVQLIGDVSGWFASGGSATNGAFTSLTPTRVLDTRVGTGAPEAGGGPRGFAEARRGRPRGRSRRQRCPPWC